MTKSLRILCGCLLLLIGISATDAKASKRIRNNEQFEYNHFIYTFYDNFDAWFKTGYETIYQGPCVVLADCADEFYMPSNLVVPDEITYEGETLPVMVFGKSYRNFKGSDKIQSITLGKNVRIASGSGEYSNLKSLKLNDNLIQIESYAFSSSSLTDITIPASVRFIGEYCFKDCPLQKITFIDDPTFSNDYGLTIEDYAFNYRPYDVTAPQLSVTLPTQSKVISNFAFSMDGLTGYDVAPGCKFFKAHDGILYKKINDNWNAWIYPAAKETECYVVPDFLGGGRICSYFIDSWNNKNVKSIDFSSLNKPIVIERNAIEISKYAGSELSIQNVDSIYSDGLRFKCYNVIVGEETRYIDPTAFGAYYNKYSVSEKNPYYTNTDKGDLLKIVEDGYELSKPYVTQSDKKYEFPKEVTALGDYAFYFLNDLEEVTFSRELKRIGKSVFFGCRKLLKVNLNNAPVEFIDQYAFYSSESMGLNNSVWYESLPKGPVYIGKVLYKWKVDENGEVNNYSLTVNGGITTITPFAFSRYLNTSAYYPKQNYNMKSVSLPSTLTYIGDGAFYRSEQLNAITIPEKVEYIGNNAFYGTALTKITVPANVKYIGRAAFSISSLKEITIGDYYSEPNTVLDKSSFTYAINAEKILIGGNVIEIGDDSFSYLAKESSPIDVEIPSSVKSIGERAFIYSRIKRLRIGEGVSCIGSSAFHTEDWDSEKQDYFTDMEEVHVLANEPPTATSSYEDTDIQLFSDYIYQHVPLFVPIGTVNKYKNAMGWSQFKRILNEGDDPNSILELESDQRLMVDGRVMTVSAPDCIPVTVQTIDGLLIYSGKGNAEIKLNSAGTVIVRIGKEVHKLLIK